MDSSDVVMAAIIARRPVTMLSATQELTCVRIVIGALSHEAREVEAAIATTRVGRLSSSRRIRQPVAARRHLRPSCPPCLTQRGILPFPGVLFCENGYNQPEGVPMTKAPKAPKTAETKTAKAGAAKDEAPPHGTPVEKPKSGHKPNAL